MRIRSTSFLADKEGGSMSLLSIDGKILEDVAYDTLNNHLKTQGLLSHKQRGFAPVKAFYSTQQKHGKMLRIMV